MNTVLVAVVALACVINITHALTPSQIFAYADGDGSNALNYGELTNIFNSFDANYNNQVDFGEFYAKWAADQLGSYPEAVSFFNGLDANNDGIIDHPNDQVGFGFFDTNYDYSISYPEFVSKFPQN